MDMKLIGSDLTPTQQDETLSDLAFFLDEFGSTGAVRIKLQEQARDIQRLEKQINRFLPQTEDENAIDNEENALKSSEGAQGVDEIMADLGFFLRTFGSTRAVCEKLYSQLQSIAELQRTVRRFRERRQTTEGSGESSGVEILGTQLASEAVERAKRNSEMTLQEELARTEGQRVEDIVMGEVGDEHACGQSSDEEVITDDGGGGRIGGAIVETSGAGSVRTFAQHENENLPTVPLDVTDEECSLKKAVSMDTMGDVMMTSGGEKDLRAENECGDREVQPPTASPSASRDLANNVEMAANFKDGRCDIDFKQLSSQCIVGNASTTIKRVTDPDNAQLIPARKFRHVCSHVDCTKRAQVNGVCYAHGGYYICETEGCNRRAATRKLCRLHGGGSRCKLESCAKPTASTGKGYCYRHAREQGIQVKRKCKAEGCNKLEYKHSRCKTHNMDDTPDGESIHEADQVAPQATFQDHDDRVRNRSVNHVQTDTSSPNKLPGGQSIVSLSEVRPRHLCKEPGCHNVKKKSGGRKGYCFRHGGGYTCSENGCTRQRQLNGVCAAHGGYRACKLAGCQKHGYKGGYCLQHWPKHSIVS